MPRNSQLEVIVTGPGDAISVGGTSAVRYLLASADANGVLESTVVGPSLPDGAYGVRLRLRPAGGGAPEEAGSASFTVSSMGKGTVRIGEWKAGKVERRTVDIGGQVGIEAFGLADGVAVDAYVVKWPDGVRDGERLLDVSGHKPNSSDLAGRALEGQPETLTAGPDGKVAGVVWASVHAEAGGCDFQAVVDVNRNGRFDQAVDIRQSRLEPGLSIPRSGGRSSDLEYDMAGDPWGDMGRTNFSPPDHVWAYGPGGLHLWATTLASVYVVAEKPNWTAGDTLTDISGPGGSSQVEQRMIVSGLPVNFRLAAHPSNLRVGGYDLIVDMNSNGKYDPGTDWIDGATRTAFKVGTDTPSGPLREWNVMVYVAADNNLEQRGLDDLQEMESVALGDDVAVTVEMDRHPGSTEEGYSAASGDWTDTRRFVMSYWPQPEVNTQPYEILGETDSGDPQRLKAFIQWAKRVAPARRYALVIWNHGAGNYTRSGDQEGGVKAACFDESSGDSSISVPELRQVITETGKLDLLAFDACLMGTIENLVELQGRADTVVASQFYVPGDGFEYDHFLSRLVQNPAMDHRNLGAVIVNTTVDAYRPRSGKIALTAYDMTKVDAVKNTFESLVSFLLYDPPRLVTGHDEPIGVLMPGIWTSFWKVASQDAIQPMSVQATRESDRSDYKDHYDLRTLLEYARDRSGHQPFKDKVNTVLRTVDEAIVVHRTTSTVKEMKGPSIWFPDDTEFSAWNQSLEGLTFNRSTRWTDLLDLMLHEYLGVVEIISANPMDMVLTFSSNSTVSGSTWPILGNDNRAIDGRKYVMIADAWTYGEQLMALAIGNTDAISLNTTYARGPFTVKLWERGKSEASIVLSNPGWADTPERVHQWRPFLISYPDGFITDLDTMVSEEISYGQAPPKRISIPPSGRASVR